LYDCEALLNELEAFADALKTSTKPGKSLGVFQKTSLQFQLIFKGGDITSLKEKIKTSNCAMQTALATLNVFVIFSQGRLSCCVC
jgi:hypothetical protein